MLKSAIIFDFDTLRAMVKAKQEKMANLHADLREAIRNKDAELIKSIREQIEEAR